MLIRHGEHAGKTARLTWRAGGPGFRLPGRLGNPAPVSGQRLLKSWTLFPLGWCENLRGWRAEEWGQGLWQETVKTVAPPPAEGEAGTDWSKLGTVDLSSLLLETLTMLANPLEQVRF